MNNKSPTSWDYPHADRPQVAWYDPRLYFWLVTDMVYIAYWWAWHKRQSLKAERWAIAIELTNALTQIDCYDIEMSEHYLEDRKERQRRALLAVADELNIQHELIDQHRDGEQ